MFITLSSDTNDFSSNSANNFRVQLPSTCILDGQHWEVALMDIQYPISWDTMKAVEGRILLHCKHNNLIIPIYIRLPIARYHHINDIIFALQKSIENKATRLPTIFHKADLAMYKLQMLEVHDPELLSLLPLTQNVEERLLTLIRNPKIIPIPRRIHTMVKKRKKTKLITDESVSPPSLLTTRQIEDRKRLAKLKENVEHSRQLMNLPAEEKIQLLHKVLKIYYKKEKKRVIIEWQPSVSIKTIELDRNLQFLLGYTADRKITNGINLADYHVNISNSLSSFSVNCNLVQSQTVGNTQQQLLRTIPITSSVRGEIVHKEFIVPHYTDVLVRQFDSIKIWIRNERGELINFQFGEVILKLHFRRKTLLTR